MKTFTFTCYWPKRNRQFIPSNHKGVVVAASDAQARELIAASPLLAGADRVELKEIAAYSLVITS